MSYDNNMSGALFRNGKKENDKHPDYRGSCEINNEEYWMSAWLKKDKNGNTYMSLSFQSKEPPKQVSAPADFDDNEDIPF